jgi:hypothetical protein
MNWNIYGRMQSWRNLNALSFFVGGTEKDHEKCSIGIVDAVVEIRTQVKNLAV